MFRNAFVGRKGFENGENLGLNFIPIKSKS